MIIEELLSSAGVVVTVAGNGKLALEALKTCQFDLILMDIQMPEMDGLIAAAQIRKDPKYNTIPIIAMTANSSPEHMAESVEAGMNDHLVKPVDVDKLYATIKMWGRHNIQQ
jgi:two-component system sensor histidine kinase/response regulator